MLRNWNLHLLLVETQNGSVAVKTSLVTPQKISTELPYVQQFYSEGYIQGIENRYSSQHLCMHVHNSTIHRSTKVETIQMSISW